jgi:BolA family transcriptional regulator, general stress-responsive regulator
MNPTERRALIEVRLQAAFTPNKLEIIDDSERHQGHPGAAGGAGHYTVIIEAEYFKGLSRVLAHRAIYQLLMDLIPHEIHALSLRINVK